MRTTGSGNGIRLSSISEAPTGIEPVHSGFADRESGDAEMRKALRKTVCSRVVAASAGDTGEETVSRQSKASPGSVYQRSDGYWVAALVVMGRRIVRYGKTERAANEKLGQLL